MRIPGLVLEFGVHQGQSLTKVANIIKPDKIYGFDSFLGLAEPWGRFPKGQWALDHTKIALPDNAELVIGWFADTLPDFVKQHQDSLSYCLINSGVYSAARDVLTNIESNIVIGTILHFGEIRCYTGCEDEIRAFNEYLERSNTEWQVLGTTTGESAAFKRTA